MELYNDILESISRLNFIASFILLVIVLRHYIFFKGQSDSQLRLWVSRVFLGDILMALSVCSYNITQYFMSPQDYYEAWALKIILKIIQLSSVIYAGWANYGLFRHIKDE